MNRTALVKNWIVVDANTSYLFPDLVGNGTVGNGTAPSGTGIPMPPYTGAASKFGGVAGSAMIMAVVGSLLLL
jgi:hypothetical protein